MINLLIEKTEVVTEELHEDTRMDYKLLKSNIKVQRDENEILYKHLKEIVKQNESQQAKILIFKAKIAELEQHVGIIQTKDEHFEASIMVTAASAHPVVYEQNQEQEGEDWDGQEPGYKQLDSMVNSIQDGEEKTIDFVMLDNGGKKLLNTISPDEPRHPSSLTKLLNENQVLSLNEGHSAKELRHKNSEGSLTNGEGTREIDLINADL